MSTEEQQPVNSDDNDSYGENDIDMFMLQHSFAQINSNGSQFSDRLT